jgi:hypothetical protein
MPLCGDCRFKLGGRIVSMRRMSNEKTVEGAPDLPEGLLPFEATVLRAMRRATVRAADNERARVVAWVRQQKASVWPDLQDLAEAVRQGDHHLSRRTSNVYTMSVEKANEPQK